MKLVALQQHHPGQTVKGAGPAAMQRPDSEPQGKLKYMEFSSNNLKDDNNVPNSFSDLCI